MPGTRNQVREGNRIVRRAMRHGLIPNFKKNVGLKNQTRETQWALHILAVMSQHGKPNILDVKKVIEETRFL
tara:strand:- start:198 stop:413 length:216 start_codon:yes stop_codon:yes gene_type:complete